MRHTLSRISSQKLPGTVHHGLALSAIRDKRFSIVSTPSNVDYSKRIPTLERLELTVNIWKSILPNLVPEKVFRKLFAQSYSVHSTYEYLYYTSDCYKFTTNFNHCN